MTIGAASAATIRAVTASIGLWCAVIGVGGFLVEKTGAAQFGGELWLLPVIFFVLGAAHELGHVVAIHCLGGRVHAVERVGSSTVVLRHDALGRRRDVLCVLAGPLAACVAGLSFACVVAMAAAPVAAFASAVAGLGHVVALAAPVGDGKQLRSLLAVDRHGCQTPA